jgi:transcriptional regulator with XRE-family HTH domain
MTGDDLRAMRQSMGHTQRSLAFSLRMGVNGWQTISDWERGVREIPGPAQIAIQYILGGMMHDTDLGTAAERIATAWWSGGKEAAAKVLGDVIASETTILCATLANIRTVTGVGMKPMLGELAGAIKASQADAVRNAKLVAYANAERAWKAAQFSPAPYVDGCANMRRIIADASAPQAGGE